MSAARPTPAQLLEAAEIIERMLAALPKSSKASAYEREAFLAGAVAGWRAAAGDPGKG